MYDNQELPRGELCNTPNCGGGKCVHRWTGQACPECGYELIHTTTSGRVYCSNFPFVCEHDE